MKKKTRPCPVCGLAFRTGQMVHILSGGAVRSVVACQRCAGKGITIVAPEVEARARELVGPFAIHLRKLAKGYRLNDEKIAIGLEIAAGILESGRLPPSDGKASNGASVTGLPVPAAVRAFQTAWHADPAARGDLDDQITVANASGLSKIERAILTVLRQRDKPTSERQLLAIAGLKYTGSYTGALADLRRAEFVAGPGRALTLTELGRAELGDTVSALPTGRALLEHWLNKLRPLEARIVVALEATAEGSLHEHELLDALGVKYTGSYTGAIAKLRKLDLLERRGAPRLTREFLEAVSP